MSRSGFHTVYNKPTVLLVDPNAAWRRTLASSLAADFGVLAADSIGAALQIVRDFPLDAVVVDACVGDRKGAEVLAEIARIEPRLADHVVFVTAGGFDARLSTFFAATATPVLYKTCDANALRAAVRRVARGTANESGTIKTSAAAARSHAV